jgi:hypothetical protein
MQLGTGSLEIGRILEKMSLSKLPHERTKRREGNVKWELDK